jgi:hypothetical protein
MRATSQGASDNDFVKENQLFHSAILGHFGQFQTVSMKVKCFSKINYIICITAICEPIV